MADSSYLTQGRTRVQINEGVEIIVMVKNERNLASLTVYGDIEGQEGTQTSGNSSSNEIYITAGVVSRNYFSLSLENLTFVFRSIFPGKMRVRRKCNFVRITNAWSTTKWPNIELFTSMLSTSKRIYLYNLFISPPIIAMVQCIKTLPSKHSVKSPFLPSFRFALFSFPRKYSDQLYH